MRLVALYTCYIAFAIRVPFASQLSIKVIPTS